MTELSSNEVLLKLGKIWLASVTPDRWPPTADFLGRANYNLVLVKSYFVI